MTLRSEFLVLSLALVVSASGATSNADEQRMKPADLPKAVKATVKKLYPDAKIVGASKETDEKEKETMYEVEMMVDGKSVDLAIDDEGELEETEKEINAADLPKAVTRAAAKRFPNAKITKVEEVTDEDDKVVYELALIHDGEKMEVVIAPNGKILAMEEEKDDEKGDKDDDDKKKDKDDKKKDRDDDDNKKKDKDGKKKDKDDDKQEKRDNAA